MVLILECRRCWYLPTLWCSVIILWFTVYLTEFPHFSGMGAGGETCPPISKFLESTLYVSVLDQIGLVQTSSLVLYILLTALTYFYILYSSEPEDEVFQSVSQVKKVVVLANKSNKDLWIQSLILIFNVYLIRYVCSFLLM